MGAPSAGDLLLAEDRHPDRRGDEALVYPKGDHSRSWSHQGWKTVEHEALFGQRRGHTIGGGFSVHGYHRVDLPAQQPPHPCGYRLGAPGDGVECADLDNRVAGPRGARGHSQMGPAGETLLQIEEQRRVLTGDRRLVAPRRRKGGGEL